MSANRVEVIDREGWRRDFPLNRPLIQIGSDPRNDIVLEAARGAGVAARQLQVIIGGGVSGYRLVNMGDTELPVGGGEMRLAPRTFIDVQSGASLRVGDFTLTFLGEGGSAETALAPGAARPASGGANIAVRLALPHTQLTPDHPLDGAVTIRNLGDKPGVQFKIDVEGLDPSWYDIGPGPVLFSGAEKDVFFRLHHPKQPRPAAGPLQLRLRVTAPAAYLGESASASQTIQVMPYYAYSLSLVMKEA
jgi:hypothetical protein